jgi:hypothetical protein
MHLVPYSVPHSPGGLGMTDKSHYRTYDIVGARRPYAMTGRKTANRIVVDGGPQSY